MAPASALLVSVFAARNSVSGLPDRQSTFPRTSRTAVSWLCGTSGARLQHQLFWMRTKNSKGTLTEYVAIHTMVDNYICGS